MSMRLSIVKFVLDRVLYLSAQKLEPITGKTSRTDYLL